MAKARIVGFIDLAVKKATYSTPVDPSLYPAPKKFGTSVGLRLATALERNGLRPVCAGRPA